MRDLPLASGVVRFTLTVPILTGLSSSHLNLPGSQPGSQRPGSMLPHMERKEPALWQYIALAMLPITWIGVAIMANRGSENAAIASVITAPGSWSAVSLAVKNKDHWSICRETYAC